VGDTAIDVIISNNRCNNNGIANVNGGGHGILAGGASANVRQVVSNNICYGNTRHGIAAVGSGGKLTITGNVIDHTGSWEGLGYGLYVNAPDAIVANNVITDTTTGYAVRLVGSRIIFTKNNVSGGTHGVTGGNLTSSQITDNIIADTTGVGVYFQFAGNNYNRISGNTFLTVTTPIWIEATTVGTIIKDNNGFPSTPAVPASTIELQNATGSGGYFPVPVRITITGGTVTKIAKGFTSGALVDTHLTTGIVDLSPGEYIALTYSVAPTWVWKGN